MNAKFFQKKCHTHTVKLARQRLGTLSAERASSRSSVADLANMNRLWSHVIA